MEIMEIWDLYNEQGQKTGDTWERSRAKDIPEGRYHIVCDVLIRHQDGDFLLMLRDPDKEIYPGCLEASAGGSALAGELPEEAARREMLEETGLTADKLELISTTRKPESRSVICAYLAVVNCEKDSIQLQQGETVGYQWVETAAFLRMIQQEPVLKLQYPRYKPYLDTLEDNQAPAAKRQESHTKFFPADDLRTSEIHLRLDRTCDAQPEKDWVPAYYFSICLPDGAKIGQCDLRIGHNDRLYIGGNIGYGIDEPYRGHHYAAKACELLLKQAQRHDLKYVIITCDPDNVASSRTCQLAGGQYLETAAVPEWHNMYDEGKRQVMVYRFDLTETPDSICIKVAETDEELCGRGYVHCTSWQEAYRGIVSDRYLDSMTVEATTARARQFPENTLVAKDKEKVVGFAVYGPSRDEDLMDAGEVIAIYVLSEYYHRKIGYRLMNEAFSRLGEYHAVFVWVPEKNERAIRFYHKYGFEFDGCKKQWNPGTPVSIVRMKKKRE